jgi:flagellar hook assembly protein FlgD
VGDPVPESIPLARLYLVGPNPATRTVRIMCELPEGKSALLAVYDALGRQVRVLNDGPLPAGAHEMHWDGRNHSGTRVAAGVYYVRFAAGSTVLTERVVVVR